MIYFTSDQHFYHSNIINYSNRPFSSVEEMNEKLIANYNSLVSPDDVVYHLGDFSLALRPVEIYVARLNGTKHLILGNHDWAHPAHKKSKSGIERWTQKYIECGFTTVSLGGVYEFKELSAPVHLSHMPYKNLEPGEHGDKYAQWRPEDKGLWLLHGHVHTQWKTKGNMINVGVDPWDYKPVSIEMIKTIIEVTK